MSEEDSAVRCGGSCCSGVAVEWKVTLGVGAL